MHKIRLDYIDIAKGIGIMSVVWAHIMLIGWTHRIIYAFHMPLFFFLSGMLFKKDKYSDFSSFFLHRCKRLFIPYIIYSVVTWGIWVAFRIIRNDDVGDLWMPLMQTFIAQGSGAFIKHNSVLWFIPCLFATEIMFFFISRYKSYFAIFICFALASLSFVLGDIWGNDYWLMPPWNFDAALIALPFYATGYYLTKKYSHQAFINYANEHKTCTAIIGIILAATLYWGAETFGECSMGSSSYQCGGHIFIIRAFNGIFALLSLSLLLSTLTSNKVITYIKWLGLHSLDVMCLHIPIKGVIIICLSYIMYLSADEVSNMYIPSLITLTITTIIVSVAILIIDRLKSYYKR